MLSDKSFDKAKAQTKGKWSHCMAFPNGDDTKTVHFEPCYDSSYGESFSLSVRDIAQGRLSETKDRE